MSGAGGLGVPHLHTGALSGLETVILFTHCPGPPGRKMGEDVASGSTGGHHPIWALPSLVGTLSLRTLSAASHCGQQGRASRGSDSGPLCGRLWSPVPLTPCLCPAEGAAALGAFILPVAGHMNPVMEGWKS